MINNIVSLQVNIFKLYEEEFFIKREFYKGADGRDINYCLQGSKCKFFVQERQNNGKVHASIMFCSIPSEYRLIPYNYAKEFNLKEIVQELEVLGITECSGFTIYGRGNLVGNLNGKWVKAEYYENLWVYVNEDSGIYMYQERGYYELRNENRGNIKDLLNEFTKMYQEKHSDNIRVNNLYNNELNKENETISENYNIGLSERMFTKVIGIRTEKSKSNAEKLKVGDIIKLLREPNNIYDKNAIAVYNINNEKIGYIARDDEKKLAEFMGEGNEYEASVTSKKSGNGLSHYVDIQITKVDLQSYSNELSNSYQIQDTKYSNIVDKPEITTIDELNKIIQNYILFIVPFDTYYKPDENKYMNDINFNLIVQIDKSVGSCTPFGESMWESGEKIEMNLKIHAKYKDSYMISEDGDCESVYIKPKVLLCNGKKYIYRGLENSGPFPGDVEDENALIIVELDKVQIFKELNKYYEIIFPKLTCDNVFYGKPIEINESIWDTQSMCDFWENNITNKYRDTDAWDQGDINEYYGYERDYDGDIY